MQYRPQTNEEQHRNFSVVSEEECEVNSKLYYKSSQLAGNQSYKSHAWKEQNQTKTQKPLCSTVNNWTSRPNNYVRNI